MKIGEIPESARSLRVTGQNLEAERFGDVVGDERTLLVFLRHLG